MNELELLSPLRHLAGTINDYEYSIEPAPAYKKRLKGSRHLNTNTSKPNRKCQKLGIMVCWEQCPFPDCIE